MSDMSPGEWFFAALVVAAVIGIAIAVITISFPRSPR